MKGLFGAILFTILSLITMSATAQADDSSQGGTGSNGFWVRLRHNTASTSHSSAPTPAHSATTSRASVGSTYSTHPTRVTTSTASTGASPSTRPLPKPYYLKFLGLDGLTCEDGVGRVPCPTPAPEPVPAQAAAAAPVAAAAPAAAPAPPQVTPGVVLTAIRRIGLPALHAHTQPKGKTLVHLPTIFYTNPRSVTRTLTLLGQPVQIQATASSFTWHYGDGTSASTTSPGARYPAMDVTHEYLDAHVTVQTSVDVTYTARFRVGNGGWQTIPGAVTIPGPPSPLRISEATALLSGDY
jgi:hypothetical protein